MRITCVGAEGGRGMRWRMLWWWFGLLAAMLCAASCESRSEARLGDDPNVVLITLDTLRADHLGCYGYETAQTPNLDRFGAAAVCFDLAMTVSNNTLPSHAAMLIGKYPQHFGLPRNGFRLPAGEETLATILQSHGYHTAALVSASSLHSSLGLNRRFDQYDEEFDTYELDQRQRRAPATTERAVAWLENGPTEPFFLWVHYFDPHYPYTPPAPFDTLFFPEYDGEADGSLEYILGLQGTPGFPPITATADDLRKLIALYDGEIAFMDANLGALFDLLDRQEHRERTLVIVVGDHGESLTEHNYYFDHGRECYQPSMHVPLMIRLPGRAASRSAHQVREPVETIDVFATVLAQLDVPIPPGTDSRDLTPLCLGRPDAGARYLCFGESCRPWRAETQYPGQWRNIGKAQFVLDYPWKLVAKPYAQSIELYRLDQDPAELDNLAASHPDVVAHLNDELQRWRAGGRPDTGDMDQDNIEALRSLGYVDD